MNQKWKKTTQKSKTLKRWVRKFQLKCMNKAWKLWIKSKKKGKKVLLALEDKKLEKILEENDKLCWDWIGRARAVKKTFEKVWKVWITRERKVFLKTHWPIFDWLKIRFDRLKINFNRSSTNQALIEPGRL